jgi:molybdopterin molybdotransferase
MCKVPCIAASWEDPAVAELVSISEARARVLGAVTPLPSEQVALSDALGRVTAEGVTSPLDVPPFDSSAMDGYAVGPGAEGELRVTGESRAGHPSSVPVEGGAAVRISTGAVVPPGTGAVVPQERARAEGTAVRVPAMAPGANIRRAGEDVRAGSEVIGAGTELGAAEVGVLAATGHVAVTCARSPRVALLTTGDELVAPGSPLAPGRIWSSNSVTLAAQARTAGAEVALAEDVPDDEPATRGALERAVAAADVVCVSGGVSVGPHDHVKGALQALGFEEAFWGVALRPGKPTWFGARGPLLAFGLPGNPVSAMVTFQLFVRPALRALQGADPFATRIEATLETAVERNMQRCQAIRCHVEWSPRGPRVRPTGPQGSHVLTSMLGAGALALVPPGGGALPAGARVEVELLRDMFPG